MPADKGTTMQKYGMMLINLAVALVYIAIGVVVAMYIEDREFETAVYVVVQIVTTIGFGDISVSPNFRVFMSFYVLIGIALIASIITDVASRAVSAGQEALRTEMRDFEGDEKKVSDMTKAVNGLIVSFLIFCFFVLGGAAFYTWYESCSCSYGTSAVVGCTEYTNGTDTWNYDQCKNTNGGNTYGFLEFLYMAIITLTTVGFGDVTPKTKIGRCWFGAPWMLCGFVAFGNFVNCVGALIGELKKGKPADSDEALLEAFDEIDANDDGNVSSGEFLAWALVAKGILDVETINIIKDRYDHLKEEAGLQQGVPDHGKVSKEFIMGSMTQKMQNSSDEG